jgi:beta-phosphoglucomutase-like phosphatase (HAD superfamily)
MNALLEDKSGLIERAEGGDGRFRVGRDGVRAVYRTADEKVDFVVYDDRTDAHVRSDMGYPATYPLLAARIDRPVRAVLMDLDGTSVRSEEFWIWIIEQTTAALLRDDTFRLRPEDTPFVSGHSVSEHLRYCIRTYCPERTVEEARRHYFEITHREMRAIEEGGGRQDAFTPSPGLKEFLLALKERDIRVAVVSSGLHEKAWPELLAAFRTLDLGDPRDFYDAIVTAGHAIRKGQAGTLGELEAKPHPWLYAEAARVGLGIEFAERHRVVGIEDSGAGVVAIRLAGFAAIGMSGGTIEASGTRGLVHACCDDFRQVLNAIGGTS